MTGFPPIIVLGPLISFQQDPIARSFGVNREDVGGAAHISATADLLMYSPALPIRTVVIADCFDDDAAQNFAEIIDKVAQHQVAVVRSDGRPVVA